jgi:hypothetical protein
VLIPETCGPLSRELSTVVALRRVLQSVANGRGIAESVVHELPKGADGGAESARRVLLGFPIQTALQSITNGASSEVSMLASIVFQIAKISAPLGGKNGEALSYILERWVKVRESNRLEERVQRFRALIASAVLGAVTAMISTLGPLLASFGSGSLGVTTGSSNFLYAGFAMAISSSAMLGVFVSGRRFYLNVSVTAAVFALVGLLVAPLADLPSISLLVVK